jgi:hypothetical protein
LADFSNDLYNLRKSKDVCGAFDGKAAMVKMGISDCPLHSVPNRTLPAIAVGVLLQNRKFASHSQNDEME